MLVIYSICYFWLKSTTEPLLDCCRDEVSTKAGFCSSNSSPQGFTGIFDRSETQNRFKDHTIVHMLYCSGDVWGGNVVRDYADSTGQPVTQKGLANAQAALDWVVQQTAAGSLSSTLSELVVSGCSAGSIGAQLWGKPITDTLSWKKASVIPDSYAGIFPPGTEGPLIKSFGMCTASYLNPSLYDTCMAGELTLRTYNLDSMGASATVPFAYIQSKTDSTQESFYVAVGATMPNASAAITPEEFYADVNAQFGAYNALPNFVTYLVDGNQHCYSPFDLYYTADAVGAKDNGDNSASALMHDWANSMPLADGESISTVCDGELQSSQKQLKNSITYCSKDVSPKSFVEKY
jgi:hypothetical protein